MINQLLKNQNTNGSFNDSLLLTGLILSCLGDEASLIKDKALKWLLSKKDDNWMFDNNLGINFIVLSAIFKCNPSIIDGIALAKILEILISYEIKEGGPYTNDLGINAAIGYFLSLQEVDLPNLEDLITKHISQKDFKSELFENKYLTIYLISKFIKNKQLLINYLKKEEPEHNILNNALILSSFANLGCDIEKNLKIKEGQDNDSLLSMALLLKLNQKERKESLFNKKEELVINKILELAKQRFSDLGEEMADIAFNEIVKTIKRNKDKQMSLMPYYTKEALGKKGLKISDKTVVEMGLANIFFWTAFIIYDDFWDEDEAQDPKILPTANLFARHYVDYFSSLPKFNKFFHNLMDKLDAANTWETMHCRARIEKSKLIIPQKLPQYDNYELKFHPSSGHILSSVAMFYSLGYGENSKEVKNLISYFKNYLIAMQINDDVHDFEEDLKRGHLSTTIVMLLEDLEPNQMQIDLINDLEKLKRMFWFKTVIKASEKAIYHTEKAREALKNIGIIENFAPLEHYIDITENVAKRTLEEQSKSVHFLNNFTFSSKNL